MSAQLRRKPAALEIPGLAYYSAPAPALRPAKIEAAHPMTAGEVLDQMFGYYAAA